VYRAQGNFVRAIEFARLAVDSATGAGGFQDSQLLCSYAVELVEEVAPVHAAEARNVAQFLKALLGERFASAAWSSDLVTRLTRLAGE
jgi:hypothetical protein